MFISRIRFLSAAGSDNLLALISGTKRFDSEKAGDREVQRTMLELLNQLDGFHPSTDIKVFLHMCKLYQQLLVLYAASQIYAALSSVQQYTSLRPHLSSIVIKKLTNGYYVKYV